MRPLLLALALLHGCASPSYQLAFTTTPTGLLCGLVRTGEKVPFVTWTPPTGHGCEITSAPIPYRYARTR